MEEAKIINKALERLYGKDIAGRPMYRIVQNLNLTEKRKGTFGIFYGSILVAEETGVANVPKYNYIEEGLWILERLYYVSNSELDQNYSYEPIWVFRDPKTGGYQAPVLEACKYLIACANDGPTKVMSEQEEKDREEQLFYEKLGGMPGVSDALAADAGVSYAGLDATSKIKEQLWSQRLYLICLMSFVIQSLG